MSLASKVTLVTSVGVSLGVVIYVCAKQQYDRGVLREAVWRDVERQQRKTENILLLQQQIDLARRLRDDREESLKQDKPNG